MPGPLPAAALQVVSAGLRGEGAPGALRGGRGAEGRTPGAGCGAEGVPSVCGAERIPLCVGTLHVGLRGSPQCVGTLHVELCVWEGMRRWSPPCWGCGAEGDPPCWGAKGRSPRQRVTDLGGAELLRIKALSGSPVSERRLCSLTLLPARRDRERRGEGNRQGKATTIHLESSLLGEGGWRGNVSRFGAKAGRGVACG